MHRIVPVFVFFSFSLVISYSAPFYPNYYPVYNDDRWGMFYNRNVCFPIFCGYFRPTIPDGSAYFKQGPIGSWIMNNEFFPIEINVPDAINSTSTNIQNFWMSIIQRFPFIHRVINGETPRPFKLIVLVPVSKAVPTQQLYNPFNQAYDNIPFYP